MLEQFDSALRETGRRIVEDIANFLPQALFFLVILGLAFLLALLVRYLLLRGLTSVEFDRRAELLGMSAATWSPTQSLSVIIATTAYWLVLAIGLLLALTAFDAELPKEFAVSVLGYVPNVLAAALILVFGSIVARFLARAVLIGAVNMGVQSARLFSLGVKWLVLIVAAAMALDHIGIGRTILLLAFGIVFGGIVLAIALAVGLGARDAVSRAIERRLDTPKRDGLDHI